MPHHHWERQRRLGRDLRELRKGGLIQAGEKKEVSKRTWRGVRVAVRGYWIRGRGKGELTRYHPVGFPVSPSLS